MDQPGLHNRHRDKNERDQQETWQHIDQDPSPALDGAAFAAGFGGPQKLSDVLATLDAQSLSQLVHDHEKGTLAGHIAHHS